MSYKLSICMMVKNEEIHIERCLESIKPIVDRTDVELIIVDTGSTDKTVSICKKYTDEVYFKEWFDDFSGMRNITISYATGEWIFILDADETMEKYDELEKFLDSEPNETLKNKTYSITGKNYTNLNNHDSYSIFPTMRLFRNDGNFRYEGTVHNQPRFSPPVGKLDIIIGHYGYVVNDKEIMDRKFNRTVALLEKELKSDPNNLYYLYQLAVSYNMHGEVRKSYEISSKIYNQFKKLDRDRQLMGFSVITNHLSNCMTLNRYNELIEASKLAINIRKDYIDGFYSLGRGYERLGNYSYAEKYYEKYLELCKNYEKLAISKDHSIALYRNNITDNMNVKLFLVTLYLDTEKYDKALLYLETLKYNISTIKLYISIFIKLKNYSEIFNLYEKIKDSDTEIISYFITYLENEILDLDFNEKKSIYNYFLNNDDEYSIYSNFMITDDLEVEKKCNLAKRIIDVKDRNNNDILVVPLSYLMLIKGFDLKLFSNMNKRVVFSCVNYFKENNYTELYLRLDEWLMNIDIRKLRIKEVSALKNLFESKLILLLNEYKGTGIKSFIKDNINMFDRYLEVGMIFINEIYNLNAITMKYELINDSESKFLFLMNIYRTNKSKGNTSVAFMYYKLAAQAYPDMADFLKEYIDIEV
ncbi:Glycosyl transferase family 2 [Acetoanaerobium noterae]|uniref:Glycosyl transferase family 2 n=1 Tax=Acetoanaerobium noterae TaxID=745369 RepID=A0A1T5D6A2_9FIRM|nr:glycosyltransferase family 2 protein [Acetoanaerobium noterae]SKB67137.1 Glycosyl transferase family 2 [Acetoanaerobium noterae]